MAALAVALGGCSGAAPGAAADAGEVVDAGVIDAGIEDAGPVDAGIADAGEVDAGPEDAGPPDAGAFDAGPEDAGSAFVVGVVSFDAGAGAGFGTLPF